MTHFDTLVGRELIREIFYSSSDNRHLVAVQLAWMRRAGFRVQTTRAPGERIRRVYVKQNVQLCPIHRYHIDGAPGCRPLNPVITLNRFDTALAAWGNILGELAGTCRQIAEALGNKGEKQCHY